jgi:ribosomal protein S18 acetylase RimI-like enzyme
MKIIQSTSSDLKQIAFVHQSAFPHHLSSALGNAFIVKTLSWHLQHPDLGFLLHLEENGKVVGYVTAFNNNGTLKHGSATTIGQYAFKKAMISFMLQPWLILHPEVRAKWALIGKQLVLKFGFQKTTIKPSTYKVERKVSKMCSLLSIGIDQKAQGMGYGSQLIQAFEREAMIRFQPDTLELSVKSDNIQAKTAYKRNGWLVRHENNGNCIMYKNLN